MSRPKSKEMDLTVGNPFWSLLKFAIPVILGNLFQHQAFCRRSQSQQVYKRAETDYPELRELRILVKTRMDFQR